MMTKFDQKLMTMDIGSPELTGARLLLFGSCVPIQSRHHLERLAEGRVPLHVCLQEEHMDRIGFKLSLLIAYRHPQEIAVLSNDGSPHCLQLHLLVHRARFATGADIQLRFFVIEEGELVEVSAETVNTGRHLSHIEQLRVGERDRVERARQEDFTRLLRYVAAVSEVTGLDQALALLEPQIVEKRERWLAEHAEEVAAGTGDPLERAFDLVYRRCFGLNERDCEVVERTPTRLVTRWTNYCPVLEACRASGLDTTTVCRALYHRSVEVLLRAIDPRLRFDRDYDRLRPHSPCCEETFLLGDRLPPSTPTK